MIVIVDYGMGNLCSVANAIRYLKQDVVISDKKEDIEGASHIILPGVGAFEDGISNLKKIGVIPIMEKEVLVNKKPFLGICLGMQMLADDGFEGGHFPGLGWMHGSVKKLDSRGTKLPHMGWNDVDIKKGESLFDELSEDKNFYFVHSYYLDCPEEYVIAWCEYGQKFAAAVRKENIFATQFHPEKSHVTGSIILKNFINFRG